MELAQLWSEPAGRVVLAVCLALVLARVTAALLPPEAALNRWLARYFEPSADDAAEVAPEADTADGAAEDRAAGDKRAALVGLDALLVTLGVVLLLIRPLVLGAYYIPSQSMEPTLYGRERGRQDYVLVNKYVYRLRAPRRGEVVVFLPPPAAVGAGPREPFVKRLIGLPGDRVEVRNHHAYINGERLDEPYLPKNLDGRRGRFHNYGPVIVPPGKYFMLGDNRANSADGRAWGYLPARDVLGRALCRFWPIWAAEPDQPGAPAHFAPRMLG